MWSDEAEPFQETDLKSPYFKEACDGFLRKYDAKNIERKVKRKGASDAVAIKFRHLGEWWGYAQKRISHGSGSEAVIASLEKRGCPKEIGAALVADLATAHKKEETRKGLGAALAALFSGFKTLLLGNATRHKSNRPGM